MDRQDLHIHTIFSHGDSAVAEEQTVELISEIRHAQTIGISDHFDYITGNYFEKYEKTVRRFGMKVGTEIDGTPLLTEAIDLPFDYFIFHLRDNDSEYKGIETLLSTGKPVIIAHPHVFEADLSRIPPEAFVEINNRYIWKCNWKEIYGPFKNRFRFILSSDAHQPNWLNQNAAKYVMRELGINESVVF